MTGLVVHVGVISYSSDEQSLKVLLYKKQATSVTSRFQTESSFGSPRLHGHKPRTMLQSKLQV